MAMMIPPILCLILSLLLSLPTLHAAEPGPGPDPGPSPSPTPWPLQFHATLVMDYHGNLSLADLWYDWPGSRNLHVIRYQLAAATPFYDIEWNNGTSFFYTRGLPPARRSCRAARVGVGILRPDWLVDGAAYLGRRAADGFDCHAWAKADFITYYEDARTKRPVKWVFYTGRTAHVMSFEGGAVLADDTEWQAPDYCFLEHDEAAAMIVNYDQSPDPKEDSLRGLVGWI